MFQISAKSHYKWRVWRFWAEEGGREEGGQGRPPYLNFILNYYWYIYEIVGFKISAKWHHKWIIWLFRGGDGELIRVQLVWSRKEENIKYLFNHLVQKKYEIVVWSAGQKQAVFQQWKHCVAKIAIFSISLKFYENVKNHKNKLQR